MMNSSNYSSRMPGAYQMYQMNSSGHSFNGSIAKNSNGFYPTAVSTPSYTQNNPNAKITSKAEEMMRRAEELSKIHKPTFFQGRGPTNFK